MPFVGCCALVCYWTLRFSRIGDFYTLRLGFFGNLDLRIITAFCRYFKERTKKTFVQYLNDMRIGHAKKFLIEGKMKISTLSMEVGFNNLSNFIEQFKKSTNMLPSEYQEKYGVKKKKAI